MVLQSHHFACSNIYQQLDVVLINYCIITLPLFHTYIGLITLCCVCDRFVLPNINLSDNYSVLQCILYSVSFCGGSSCVKKKIRENFPPQKLSIVRCLVAEYWNNLYTDQHTI